MMGGSQQPATTTQIQKVELPAWVDKASQENYAQAQATSANLTPSAPQNVAPQNDLQAQAVDWLNQSTGQSRGLIGQAQGMYGAATQPIPVSTVADPAKLSFQGVTPTSAAFNAINPVLTSGYQPVGAAAGVKDVASWAGARDVGAKSFLDRDINAYMNPYTQNVIDATDAASRRDESLSLMKNSDVNRASGAYGGSRDAITNAVLQSEGVRNRANTDANLRSAGFTDAANRIQSDNALDLQAQTSNQGADIAKGQLNANIGIANQNSALNTQSLNQNTFLQNAAQDIAAQQYNAGVQNNTNQYNASNAYDASKFNSTQNLAAQQFNSSGKYNADAANVANTSQIGMFNSGAQNTANLAQASNTLQAANGVAGLAGTAGQLGNAQSLLAANLGGAQQANTQSFMDAQTANAGLGNQDATNALNMRLAALGMSPYGKTTTSNSVSQGGTSSNGAMSAIGGMMSILPMLFPSDKNVKKDIKRVGKVGNSDLNKYEFKYKKGFMGADMGDGKYTGVMAQDVEKKIPGAVHKVRSNGQTFKAVDYAKVAQHGFMGR